MNKNDLAWAQLDRQMLNDDSVRMVWMDELDPVIHSVRFYRDIFAGDHWGAGVFRMARTVLAT